MVKRTLKELTLKDNFMFGAVMSDEENCRRLLEMILQFPIARVEMQAVYETALGKRTRYYHSQIDMELLQSGADYTELPDTYVIFICDFDPFGEHKYCYTFEQRCQESETVCLNDGSRSIFLSTCGENPEDVPVPMVKFLEYVKADLSESQKDFEDEYVATLQRSVQRIKSKREMEERFMLWELLLRDERREGRVEILLEILNSLGDVSEDLKAKITSEARVSVLAEWTKLAAKSESIEQFIQKM